MNDAVTQWLNSALMDLRSIEKIMDDFFFNAHCLFSCATKPDTPGMRG